MKLVLNKRSGAVVMSPDSEGLDAAVVAGVGSNLTQPSGISHFSLYNFFLKYLHQLWSWAGIAEVCLNLKLYICLINLMNAAQESDPHQASKTKGKDRQMQLCSHKMNRWQAALATLSQKGGNSVTQT